VTGPAGIVQDHPAAHAAAPAFRPVLRMSALDLRPLPGAVPSARLHTRHVITEWGYPAIASDCETIVSELVTNASRHARAVITPAGPPPVRLRLTGSPRGIRIEVRDASSDLPQLPAATAPDALSGRGLLIVAALATRWGAYRTAAGGKCVWAVIGP
jgi:anti-sigma regulatory factor (Ser/Thr protein kinase)